MDINSVNSVIDMVNRQSDIFFQMYERAIIFSSIGFLLGVISVLFIFFMTQDIKSLKKRVKDLEKINAPQIEVIMK